MLKNEWLTLKKLKISQQNASLCLPPDKKCTPLTLFFAFLPTYLPLISQLRILGALWALPPSERCLSRYWTWCISNVKNNPLKSRIEECDYSTKNMVITSFEPEQWLKCRAQELQTYKTLHF